MGKHRITKQNRNLYKREDVEKEILIQRNLNQAAISLGMHLHELMDLLRIYREYDLLPNFLKGVPTSVAIKPDPNFKDPFPSRNIEHPDKPDNFGGWSYKHHWMENPAEETVGVYHHTYPKF